MARACRARQIRCSATANQRIFCILRWQRRMRTLFWMRWAAANLTFIMRIEAKRLPLDWIWRNACIRRMWAMFF